MASINATQSLAAALAAAQRRDQGHSNIFVDRLATALAIPANDQSYLDDEGDDDLDLPMLVQGNRALVPATYAPVSPGREGRAALIGFGLGLALLVPIGMVMSYRLADTATVQGGSAVSATIQSLAPLPAVTEEAVIRTTRRPTQVESGIQLSPVTPAVAAVPPVEAVPTVAPVEPAAKPAAKPWVPAAPPPADHLTEGMDLIAKGDIEAARRVLQPGAVDGNPEYLMALAETFDPNMLAAWSARGATADVMRARALYQSALTKGANKARQRLEALD